MQSGKTLTTLIEDALRETLARRHRGKRRARVTRPTFQGKGRHAGIDLDDSADLLDVMTRKR